MDPLRICVIQGVKPAPPMVLHGLALQARHVLEAGLFKQALAVESVFAQHAQAPTVDGVDRRFIHPLRGIFQSLHAAGMPTGVDALAQ